MIEVEDFLRVEKIDYQREETTNKKRPWKETLEREEE